MMYKWTVVRCDACWCPIDMQKEKYRKITDRQMVSRHWHNDPDVPLKDCWNRMFPSKLKASELR